MAISGGGGGSGRSGTLVLVVAAVWRRRCRYPRVSAVVKVVRLEVMTEAVRGGDDKVKETCRVFSSFFIQTIRMTYKKKFIEIMRLILN